MLNLHLLECTVKGYDHISDLLLAKYWVITGYKYEYCSSLTGIEIPNSVTTIGELAFGYCSNIRELTIGESVASIGNYAFRECYSLEKVTSHIAAENLFAINEYVFFFIDLGSCTLYVPKGAKDTYAATEGWNAFGDILEIEETGIDNIGMSEDIPAVMYDLNGRVTDSATRGIHINNGKKVLVK